MKGGNVLDARDVGEAHQGLLPFEYEENGREASVTAYGGLPLVLEMLRALGVEQDMVVADEFRDGNVPAQVGVLPPPSPWSSTMPLAALPRCPTGTPARWGYRPLGESPPRVFDGSPAA